MKIRPIRTDNELDVALARISVLLGRTPGKDDDELELLSLVVESYERMHHPIPSPDPIVMLRFLMEQQNVRPKDMLDVFGTSGRASEILSKQRPLTLPMIRKLAAKFHVSADCFIAQYACAV